MKKIQNSVPCHSPLTIYKSFILPNVDYGDIIYDQPNNETFCQKLESLQYNAAFIITGAIKVTSREELYKELGLESLNSRRWLKITGFLRHLYDTLPQGDRYDNIRNTTNI